MAATVTMVGGYSSDGGDSSNRRDRIRMPKNSPIIFDIFLTIHVFLFCGLSENE